MNNTVSSQSSFATLMSQTCKIKLDQLVYGKNSRRNFKNTIFIIIFIVISFLISFGIASGTGGYDMGFLFQSMFGFGDFVNEWLVLACILGVAGLSFMVAHKSGLFNIGISGQMLAAGLAVVGLSVNLTKANSSILNSEAAVLISIIVAMLTGAFVALISGLLKNFFNINEVVSAIMINWIVFFLAKFLIVGTAGDGAGVLAGENGNSASIATNLALYDPTLDSGVVGSTIIFAILIVGIFVMFKFTSFGKKIIAVGKSQKAGIYSGYYTKSLQLSSFVMSGAIAGLLGLIVYAGNTSTTGITSDLTGGNMLPAEGFNGIAISLVSFSNPIVIIPISLLFAMVQFANGFPSGLSDLTLSFTMYSVAIFVVIYRLQPIVLIKKLLIKKGKYTTNHFVNKYDQENNEYINDVRKKIANRDIQIYVSKQEYKHLSFNERFKKSIEYKTKINSEYINAKKELDAKHIPWYKSIKLNYAVEGDK